MASDGGDYVCNVRNKIGSAAVNVRLLGKIALRIKKIKLSINFLSRIYKF